MEDFLLYKELTEAFRPIMEMNNVRFRQVKTMLAGFIATQERDLYYMDTLFRKFSRLEGQGQDKKQP